MDKSTKHKYCCRPAYGSNHLLIEFISGVEKESFLHDLFNALKEINPQLTKAEDMWMNDEVLFSINSSHGQFTLSKDIWDFGFIMSENQDCIKTINDLLLSDSRFEKMEVNFENYKTPQ
jgi:hypothetical protein